MVTEHKFFCAFCSQDTNFPSLKEMRINWDSKDAASIWAATGHRAAGGVERIRAMSSPAASHQVCFGKELAQLQPDCCVSPWADGCVSITPRLSHRTECQVSNMTGNHRRSGLCLWPHGKMVKELERWSLRGQRLLLLLMSASASLCLPGAAGSWPVLAPVLHAGSFPLYPI